MYNIRARCFSAVGALVLATAIPIAALADTTTPNLRIANNESGSISLSSQSPGNCGTWIGSAVIEPPPVVGASSTSAAFKLSVSGSCATVNSASMTYVFSNGEVLTYCTYGIVGNSTFTYSATGAPGCSYAIDTLNHNVDFIFPNTDRRVRMHQARK